MACYVEGLFTSTDFSNHRSSDKRAAPRGSGLAVETLEWATAIILGHVFTWPIFSGTG